MPKAGSRMSGAGKMYIMPGIKYMEIFDANGGNRDISAKDLPNGFIDVLKKANELGYKVPNTSIAFHESNDGMWNYKDSFYISVFNHLNVSIGNNDPETSRWAFAHELGHAISLTTKDAMKYLKSMNSKETSPARKFAERFADNIAKKLTGLSRSDVGVPNDYNL